MPDQPWNSPPNQVLAGPAAGTAEGGSSFRALVLADLPAGATTSEAASSVASGGLAASVASSVGTSGGLRSSVAESSATSAGLAASVAMSTAIS